MFFHFVQKSGLERLAKKGIVEMLNDTPKNHRQRTLLPI